MYYNVQRARVMTKFQELAEAYARASQRGTQYRQEIINLATAIGRGFETYLSCPSGTVGYYPVVGKTVQEVESDRLYSILQALEIDEGDSYWHFGLKIKLNPLTWYGLHFAFFIRPPEYLIRLMPDAAEVTVNAPLQNDSLLPLFDAVHKQITDYFDTGLSRFLERGGQPRKIGF